MMTVNFLFVRLHLYLVHEHSCYGTKELSSDIDIFTFYKNLLVSLRKMNGLQLCGLYWKCCLSVSLELLPHRWFSCLVENVPLLPLFVSVSGIQCSSFTPQSVSHDSST